MTAHRSFIEEAAGPEPEAFMYVGLRIMRPAAAVLEHVRAWADRDVEAARCIAGSGTPFQGAVGPEAVGSAASIVFTEILKDATPAQGSARMILSPPPGAADLLPWLSRLPREYPAALSHVRGVSLPQQIVAGWPLTSQGGLEVGLPTADDSSRRLFDFEDIRLPPSAEDASRLVISIARAHPMAAPALAGVLQNKCWRVRHSGDAAPPARPSNATVVELAKLGPPFFRIVIEADWLDALHDAVDLVDAAAALDIQERALALAAIGRPARVQLGTLVDELLKTLASETDGWAGLYGPRLAKLADEVAYLGLPFWEKRLTRPHAFKWLWQSVRLREAFTLHPEPVYRLIRRAVEKEPQAAIEALSGLVHWLDTFPLAPLCAEVVALAGTDESRLAWPIRLRLLAHAGSAEARELALRIASDEDTNVYELNRVAGQDAAVWHLLAGTDPLVDGQHQVDELREDLVRICSPAAIAAVDALFDCELGPPSPSAAKGPRSTYTDVLMALLRDHHAAIEPERLSKALANLQAVLTPEAFAVLAAATAKDDADRAVPPLPWSHLFDSDLGYVLPEIGRWFADRVTDPAWMRHDLGKVLRPAIIARYRDALGERGDEIMARLGDQWPTQAAVVKVAAELGITVDAAAAARCADEAVPPIFRAALARLPLGIEGTEGSHWSDEHWIVRWVFESVWPDAPELLARHVAAVFESASDATWRRGLALALVALREPCGTTVPDALTAAARAAATDDERDFYKRQRDTFARAHAARQQDVAGEVRSREALQRIRRFARKARGVQ